MEKRNFDETSMEIFYKKLKCSIFISYYNMLSRQFRMNILYILMLFICSLQITGLAISHITYAKIPSNAYSNVLDLVSLVRIVVLLYPNGNFIYANIMLYSTFAILMLHVAIFMYYFYYNDPKIVKIKAEKSKRQNLIDFFFLLILLINILIETIFIIPIFVTLFSFIQCSTVNNLSFMVNYPSTVCYTKHYYSNIIIASVCFIIYVIILVLNVMFLTDNRPVSDLPTSGLNKISKITNILLNVTLAFCYSFDLGDLIYNFKVFLTIILIVITIIYYGITPLFHQKLVFKFRIFFEGSYLFNSVFSLIHFYLKTVYNIEIIIVQIFTSIVFGLLIVKIIEKIQFYYTYRKKIESNKPILAINMLTLLIEDSKDFNFDKNKRIHFLGILYFHKINCANIESCSCSKYMKVLNEVSYNNFDRDYIYNDEKMIYLSNKTEKGGSTDKDLSLKDCIFGTIKLYLEDYMSIFPKNIELTIMFAYFMTYYVKNIYKALFEMMKIPKHKSGLINEFDTYYLHNEIEKIMYKSYLEGKKDNIDIETTLKYNSLSFAMLDLIDKTTQTAIEFWLDVKSDFNRSKIYDSAVKISKNIQLIRENYDELVNKLKYKNVKLLYLYYDFLEKIIFYEQDCKEIKDKIIQYTQSRDNSNEFIESKETSMSAIIENNVNVGTAVISGNLTDLGVILSVNLNFCKLFKLEKNDILKNSVNNIIPYYISQFHESFIKRYFNTAVKNVLDVDRILFGLKSTGFLVPVILHTKIIPNLDQSIRFIGYMKKIEKIHNFFKSRLNPANFQTAFLLVNNEGSVFGISKTACLLFGIPLNVLLNAKVNSDQSKTLNIKTLFPDTNFYDPDIDEKLQTEGGIQVRLDSKGLKDFFEDFKETCMEGSKLTNIFEHDFSNKFVSHDVNVNMYKELFNNKQLVIKILKIVKIEDEKEKSERKLNDILSPKLNNLKFGSMKELNNVTESNFNFERPKVEDKEIKMFKNDLNKSKKNLLKIKYPKQVKLFLISITLFLIVGGITGFLDMYFKLVKFGKIANFFNIWVPYLKKNLYYTDMVACLQSLMLIQNGFYSPKIMSNQTNLNFEINLLKNKIIYDLNQSIIYVNNLTFKMSTLDDNLSYLYSNETFFQQSVTNEKNTYSFESNDLNVRAGKIVAQNFTLKFDNWPLIFNYKSDLLGNETTLLYNYLFFNNNSLTIFRQYTEKINQKFIDILFYSDLITSSKTSFYLCLFGILSCIVIYSIISKILSNITTFKTKILKIFFLIDKKWADIIIKRCKRYIDYSQNFLISKDNQDKLSFFNVGDKTEDKENDHAYRKKTTYSVTNKNLKKPNAPNSKKHSDASPDFKRSETFKVNNDKLNDSESAKDKEDSEELARQEEENNLEIMKALINKFRKKRWLLYFKIFILVLIICVFFIVTIFINVMSNRFETDKNIIQQISDRGWNYNNLGLFYRSMIMQGNKKSSEITKYDNFANLYMYNTLDSYDLFNLYISKVTYIESNVQNNLNGNSALLTKLSAMQKSMSSSSFCSNLLAYDPNFYSMFQSNCDNFNNGNNKVGLTNLIAFSSNFFLNKFNKFIPANYNFDVDTIKSLLSNEDLSLITDTNILFINQAFIILLDYFLNDVTDYNNYNVNFSIIYFVIFIIFTFIEWIFYMIISNSLKNMINKDKAILAIIPSEAITNNEKMKVAFNDLKI